MYQKYVKFSFVLISCFFTLVDCCFGANKKSGDSIVSIIPIPVASKANFLKSKTAPFVLVDPDYFTWGATVIKWTDGKYHAYYARWPRSKKFAAWMTDCEIAHAISDKPEGPFKTTGVVLESRNADGWDLVNAHNPSVCVADGKIHLYYISNKLKGKFPEDKSGSPFPTDEWLKKNHISVIRNTQYIGLAVGTNPEGPFIRTKKPVVEPLPGGLFKNIAVNPAVTYSNCVFTMIMKGDDPAKEKWFRMQLVGQSKKAEGPFKFEKQPVYKEAQTEDAGIWYNKETKTYNMICHVMSKPDMALFTSKDGIKWNGPTLFMKKEIPLDDGRIWKPARVERPFVLTDDNGVPIMIYVAIFDKGISGNIAIPLKAIEK